MTIARMLIAATLIASPVSTVWAACSGHSEASMTCAEGTVYDKDTGTCKVITG